MTPAWRLLPRQSGYRSPSPRNEVSTCAYRNRVSQVDVRLAVCRTSSRNLKRMIGHRPRLPEREPGLSEVRHITTYSPETSPRVA